MNKRNIIRPGLKDMWNSYMVAGVKSEEWSENDIPFCPTTAADLPQSLVSYSTAKTLHRKMLIQKGSDYHINAYLHCYIDDSKFDGPFNSIWKSPNRLLRIAEHYEGIITPDFSTYVDFPDPIRRYNTYRMRAFGRCAADLGYRVINNVRWGFSRTWKYDFDGLPHNSLVAIGTVGSGIRYIENRPLFDSGLREFIRTHSPHTLIICGSVHLPVFDELKNQGICVLHFDSETNVGFKKTSSHE